MCTSPDDVLICGVLQEVLIQLEGGHLLCKQQRTFDVCECATHVVDSLPYPGAQHLATSLLCLIKRHRCNLQNTAYNVLVEIGRKALKSSICMFLHDTL